MIDELSWIYNLGTFSRLSLSLSPCLCWTVAGGWWQNFSATTLLRLITDSSPVRPRRRWTVADVVGCDDYVSETWSRGRIYRCYTNATVAVRKSGTHGMKSSSGAGIRRSAVCGIAAGRGATHVCLVSGAWPLDHPRWITGSRGASVGRPWLVVVSR